MNRLWLALAGLLSCAGPVSAQVLYGPAAITGGTIKNTDITGGTITGVTIATPIVNGAFNLLGSGTSGQNDAQISVTGGGSVAGQGTLNYKAGFHMFQAYDGSPQFAVGYQLGAVEYWSGMGGFTGLGGTLYASNGTVTGNVDGNFAAQNQGQFWFGNGSGTLFAVLDPGGPVGASLTAKPANANASPGATTAALVSTGDLALVPSGGANRITVNIPDGTAVGGNNRGGGAVDLQFTRASAVSVCSGTNSFCAGSNNIGSGSNAFVGGFANLCDGSWCSMAGGQDGAVNGRYGLRVYSNGIFAGQGDAQIADGVIRGNSTAGGAIRLVANGAPTNAAGSTNCVNLPAGKSAAMNLTLLGVDQSHPEKTTAWFNKGLLSRPTTAASMLFSMGTATTLGSDTVTVSASADTTNGCLNFTVTPDNSDTWHFALSSYNLEVQ
jgi:hypothetical protein